MSASDDIFEAYVLWVDLTNTYVAGSDTNVNGTKSITITIDACTRIKNMSEWHLHNVINRFYPFIVANVVTPRKYIGKSWLWNFNWPRINWKYKVNLYTNHFVKFIVSNY